MTSVYDSDRLAAGYAFDRPPVHEQILRSARLAPLAGRALDIGCGAGLSTEFIGHLPPAGSRGLADFREQAGESRLWRIASRPEKLS